MKSSLLILLLSLIIANCSFAQQSPVTVTVDGKPVIFECVAMAKSYDVNDNHNEDSVIGKVQYVVIAGWCGVPKHSDFITIFIHGNCCDKPVNEGRVSNNRYELRYKKYLKNENNDTGEVIYSLAYDSTKSGYANVTYTDSSTIKGVFEGKVILHVGQQYNIEHMLYIKGIFNLPIYYEVNGEYIFKGKEYFQM